jgi:elongation factor G
MRIEPLQRDAGVDFTQSLVGQNVDRVFVPSVEKGVQSACREGILAGCHVTDLKVDFYDGKMHPVDSKDIAFQIAGKEAFRQAFQDRVPLPPRAHHVDPGQGSRGFHGRRHGRHLKPARPYPGYGYGGQVPGHQRLRPDDGIVPLQHNSLRSLTGGRGFHSESFSHYEEMPRDLEQKTIERLTKK